MKVLFNSNNYVYHSSLHHAEHTFLNFIQKWLYQAGNNGFTNTCVQKCVEVDFVSGIFLYQAETKSGCRQLRGVGVLKILWQPVSFLSQSHFGNNGKKFCSFLTLNNQAKTCFICDSEVLRSFMWATQAHVLSQKN